MKVDQYFSLGLLFALIWHCGCSMLLLNRQDGTTSDGGTFVMYWFAFSENGSYAETIPGYGQVSFAVNQSAVRIHYPLIPSGYMYNVYEEYQEDAFCAFSAPSPGKCASAGKNTICCMNPHYTADGSRGKPTGVYCLQRSRNYTAYTIKSSTIEAVTHVRLQNLNDIIEVDLSATNSIYQDRGASFSIMDGGTTIGQQFAGYWALFDKPPQVNSPLSPDDWFALDKLTRMTRSLNMSQELWAVKAQASPFCAVADYSITKPFAFGSNKMDQYDKFRATDKSVFFRKGDWKNARIMDSIDACKIVRCSSHERRLHLVMDAAQQRQQDSMLFVTLELR